MTGAAPPDRAERPARKALAYNVRRLRNLRRWSQERLAAEAGDLRQGLISELELAKANPTLATLEFVAAALGVTVRDLFKPARARRRPRASG
jgi:transcriptional regulator with XRE-family HTH domain